MSSRKLVSVVVATSPCTGSPRAAIDSVLAQTYAALELIVVDGARVAEARRRALRAARGEYVTFLDAADLMRPAKIARQAALLDANPRLGAVHCRHHVVDAAGRVIETVGRQPDGDLRVQLLQTCLPWSGGPLVRRDILLRIAEDERPHWLGDWGMWLRVALSGNDFGCVQEPLGCRRVRPDPLTADAVARRERTVFELLEEVYRRWALPAEAMARRERIHAGWHFRLGCDYASVGDGNGAARSFARVAALCPAWSDAPGPMLDLLHAEAISPRARARDAVRLVETVLDHLPSAFDRARSARASLLGRVHVALASDAHAAGDRIAVREHLESAIRADPQLLAAPDRFAADLVGHARRVAAGDPRGFVLRVLDALPPPARAITEARSLALAEIAVAEAIRDYRMPRARCRKAGAAPGAAAHRTELLLGAPRRVSGRVVDRLRQPNPVRRATSA